MKVLDKYSFSWYHAALRGTASTAGGQLADSLRSLEEMATTIYDVAKRAGVGVGTVSRVLNNSSHITPETKQKVLQAIAELKYEPHALAQGLARRRTNTVGCIVPFFTGHFYVELLRGIQDQISIHRYDLILYSVDLLNKKEIFLRRALRERKTDGVLLVSLKITDDFVRKFKQTGLPLVLVDAYHPEVDSITVDNIEGAYRATEHLITLGHSKVAIIDGQLKSIPARLRLEGYKKALADHNLAYCSEYVVTCDFVQEEDGFNKAAGYAAMKRLLSIGDERPTAVFVSSDIQAAGALEALKEASIRVPDDLAIVGFDDIELARYLGLTTMRQPIFEMGRLAVERLVARIKSREDEPFQKTFSTELVVRESCGSQRSAGAV
jgi:LacI family transcriptional regulator